MKLQRVSLAGASMLVASCWAQTTTSQNALESLLGAGISIVRSVVSADPTTVTTTMSPSSTTPSTTSSLSTFSTSRTTTTTSPSLRPSSSSTTSASRTSSSTISSSSSLSSATTPSASTTPSAAASADSTHKDESSDRNLAIILGTVLGSLALLSLVVFFCCLRRHRKRHPHDHIGYDHMEKTVSSSRQSLAGTRNSTGALMENSRSRSSSHSRSIDHDYSTVPPVPAAYRFSQNDSMPYGAVPTSVNDVRNNPFQDQNITTPGRYYDRSTHPAHRAPHVPKRSPQRQSEHFLPYDAQRETQKGPPRKNLVPAKTQGESNYVNGIVRPGPPLQTQQKHRSLPRSSLANEFNFGFDGQDSGDYGNDVPREFRRKGVPLRGY